MSELAEDADHLGHDPGVGLRTLGLVIRAEAGRVHHHHRPPGVPAPRPLPAIIIMIIIIIIIAINEVMSLHNDSNSIQLVTSGKKCTSSAKYPPSLFIGRGCVLCCNKTHLER